MIIGHAIISTEGEHKSRHEKRIEERVKCLRALGHVVTYVSVRDEFYPVGPTAFTKQDPH